MTYVIIRIDGISQTGIAGSNANSPTYHQIDMYMNMVDIDIDGDMMDLDTDY